MIKVTIENKYGKYIAESDKSSDESFDEYVRVIRAAALNAGFTTKTINDFIPET